MSVAIIQSQPYHFEVVAALLYTVVQLGLDVRVFCPQQRQGNIQQVVSPWYSIGFAEYGEFEAVSCEYDTIVFTTFIDGDANQFARVSSKHCARPQKLVVVLHNLRTLRTDGNIRLIEKLHILFGDMLNCGLLSSCKNGRATSCPFDPRFGPACQHSRRKDPHGGCRVSLPDHLFALRIANLATLRIVGAEHDPAGQDTRASVSYRGQRRLPAQRFGVWT